MSKTPDGYVEMSLNTLIEVFQAMTPTPGRMAELTDVPVELIQALMKFAMDGEMFDTDPSTGIFGPDPSLYTDMQLALNNELRCPNCSGDGNVWDDAEYEKRSTWAIMHKEIPEPDNGWVLCPTCKGESKITPDQWREYHNPAQVI